MSGYTLLNRRKSDGRWSFLGTMSVELAEKQDVDSLEWTVVRLPRNFLAGSKVRARIMPLGGGELFLVPQNREAIIWDE